MLVHRLNHRSTIKHSQSGDVSQTAQQRPKGRRKLQRGQSEDVPYSPRPQVHTKKTLHSNFLHLLCCLHTYYYFFFLQECVELKQVENVSDTEGYPSLEGHCRAASLPRLNAEYYVSSPHNAVSLVLLLTEKFSLAHSQLFCLSCIVTHTGTVDTLDCS